VRLVPDTEVVQTVEFETDDPAMQGEMTITYTLADAGHRGIRRPAGWWGVRGKGQAMGWWGSAYRWPSSTLVTAKLLSTLTVTCEPSALVTCAS
jgi:hypothetical protein